jgi:hypothetical protein
MPLVRSPLIDALASNSGWRRQQVSSRKLTIGDSEDDERIEDVERCRVGTVKKSIASVSAR